MNTWYFIIQADERWSPKECNSSEEVNEAKASEKYKTEKTDYIRVLETVRRGGKNRPGAFRLKIVSMENIQYACWQIPWQNQVRDGKNGPKPDQTELVILSGRD
jgi:hypothetical protein